MAVPALTSSRRTLSELLAEARARTIFLVSPLKPEEIQVRPDDSVDSVLDVLDRIVRFEKDWLAGRADTPGTATTRCASYDEWFDHMLEVRQRTLERLAELEEPGDLIPLPHRARLVLEHEYRCSESILEIAQLLGETYRAPRRTVLPRGRRLADPGFMVRFSAGGVTIGAPGDSLTWPEERPAHRVELKPFWIDVMPVTNGDYATFMGAGGYVSSELWSDEGWAWARGNEVQMPRHWYWEDGAWWSRWMDRRSPLDLAGPVSMVSYYEAEAFARFVGKRLPTEIEWEAAACWDSEAQARRNYPWGGMPPSPNVANLDQLGFQPAAVGAFPGNLSPIGCYGMIGDLWEWTSSDFLPYPGQKESSPSGLASFGREWKVLRGGSWASRPGAVRGTSRRPALPSARHLFTGFRCACDA